MASNEEIIRNLYEVAEKEPGGLAQEVKATSAARPGLRAQVVSCTESIDETPSSRTRWRIADWQRR